jgi:hypothetical protein
LGLKIRRDRKGNLSGLVFEDIVRINGNGYSYLASLNAADLIALIFAR